MNLFNFEIVSENDTLIEIKTYVARENMYKYRFDMDNIIKSDFQYLPIVYDKAAVGVVFDKIVENGNLYLKCYIWKNYCQTWHFLDILKEADLSFHPNFYIDHWNEKDKIEAKIIAIEVVKDYHQVFQSD